MRLMDLKQQHAHALAKAESITKAAESGHRELTAAETLDYDTAMTAVSALAPQIAKIQRQNTVQQLLVEGRLIPAGGNLGQARTPGAPVVLSEEYFNQFFAWLGTRGQTMGADLYEGSGSAGGFVVPSIVDGQIIPLAPTEMGVRRISMVVPTAMDIKLPRGGTIGKAAGKLESGGGDMFSFRGTDPTLEQFTLSAFMAGATRPCSFELLQDVPSFQSFMITDLLLAQQLYEGNLYVNGTGTNEAEGLIGNTGTGVTDVAAGTDSYGGELLDATFDVLGKLNAAYHPGAGWLMARATGVSIRKAQRSANLFQPVWTRENGQDYLHGYPVTFDGFMPAIAAGNTPVLFGDFKQGYLIGDRGGSGINIKILDQPKATEGQVILLGYRRTDGRVRRSEAIQAITLAD